ncbi:MAG: TlyA family RNA methyltransferase [Deltaproteobacteria bacterium]|nr:TlyA family RNA methyltransferase [Deltaproteobacteria bacterium]
MTKKIRLDELLVSRGLFPSLAQAQSAIMAGEVFVQESLADKAGHRFAPDSTIKLRSKKHPFVSRGGVKLFGALHEFNISVDGFCAMDVGASTGGFTDCLLEQGVRRVYAVDVGKGLLAWKLRCDERVVVWEGVNIRNFDTTVLTEALDIAVIDVSFISLRMVLPVITQAVRKEGIVLALIKPQFEAKREEVGAGGIITDEAVREKAIQGIVSFARAQGLEVRGVYEAQPAGHDGNKEFFLYCINHTCGK